jgi:hypothetical protein
MKEALLALGSGRALLQGRATADALIRRGLVERKRPMYPGSTGSWLSLTPEGYQAIIDLDGAADPSLDELLAESEGSCSGWCRPPENLCGWCSRQALIAERDRLAARVAELEDSWAHHRHWLLVISDGTCDHERGLWCSHCRARHALALGEERWPGLYVDPDKETP